MNLQRWDFLLILALVAIAAGRPAFLGDSGYCHERTLVEDSHRPRRAFVGWTLYQVFALGLFGFLSRHPAIELQGA